MLNNIIENDFLFNNINNNNKIYIISKYKIY